MSLQTGKLTKLMARLKSLMHKPEELEDCILVREIESRLPTTGLSQMSAGAVGRSLAGGSGVGSGAIGVKVCVLSVYLPQPGEYALEVFGAPPDVEDGSSYFLVLEAYASWPLSKALRSRLATVTMGPQDDRVWMELGLRTSSHPDPLIRVPTTEREGSRRLLNAPLTKSQVLQNFASRPTGSDEPRPPLDASAASAELADPQKAPILKEGGQGNVVNPQTTQDADLVVSIEALHDRRLIVLGQLVDITGEEEEVCSELYFTNGLIRFI
ncbi:unnamed protein product [Protopolystoma xenopodis]|uniref:Uncharacterized protein n=1 Tax=Protopolystoma xenopodis TaxID=117903 RepID=A0A3S5AYI9_9PLAT|nr:unnamed protein product [Protopolystoma xenopodis]